MNTITVGEATEVCGQGIIALPVHMGRLHGRVEKDTKRPIVRNGCLELSSGKRIPWTPANEIKW